MLTRCPKKCLVIYSLFISICTLIAIVFYSNYEVNSTSNGKVYYATDTVPTKRVALILGAGIRPNGSPSLYLRERIEAGVDLYTSGKVQKLLVSGDNRTEDYNEPEVMKKFAVDLGVKPEDVQEDFAGRRTYDSCYRAKSIFSLDEVIVVTQEFHIRRSIFLCEKMHVKTVGYVAQTPRLYSQNAYETYLAFREFLANINAVADVYVLRPKVVGGEKIDL